MMSEPADEESQHRRPHSKPEAAPYIELDLVREIEELHREPEWKNGHNAKTLVKYDSLRVVLIGLKAQSRIPPHQTEGRVSIHTIRGHVHVRAEGRTFSLPAGTLLALDKGLRHDVEALEDSAFLLSIAWPGQDGQLARQGGGQ
jgi:quercetin dioxygenase-like cupin family protein